MSHFYIVRKAKQYLEMNPPIKIEINWKSLKTQELLENE